MKKLKLIIPLVALAFFSCDNYLDINENPNQATESNVNPKLTLAAAQSASYSPLVRRMNELGSVFMNHWGPNVNSFTGGYAEEFGITMSNNFYEDIWTSVYRSTYEYSRIINFQSADYDNHKAIAKIMKAFHFQYLVDAYGDVPYSEALQGSANTTPVYDNANDIYDNLIVILTEAQDLIANPDATAIVPSANQDIMLHGDMAMWAKFANTIKLRILLRQSEKAGLVSQADFELQKSHFKSKSGSDYFFNEEGVYRISNHWGRVANCRWRLIALENYKNQETKVGFAKWIDFYPNDETTNLFFIQINFDKKTVDFFHKDMPFYDGKAALRNASETAITFKIIKQILNEEDWAKYLEYDDLEGLRKEIVTKMIYDGMCFGEVRREYI